MKPATAQDVRSTVFQLLKESFEGPPSDEPSAFLEKGTGLFQTLDEITPEAASAQARPEGSTIAAHAEHVRFYVEVHYEFMRGSTARIDWTESWRIQRVNTPEWDRLRLELRQIYSNVTEYLRAIETWSEDEISLAMSIVAHSAYHLGAIRQLLLVARGNE
jgi:hypothetical protein